MDNFVNLYTFSGSEGSNPFSSLIFNNSKTILYGTTYQGGTYNLGTLFSFNIGNKTINTLHHFSGIGHDGATVYSSLIFNNTKTILYGTTYIGGTYNLGTLFSFNINTNILTTLHSFDGSEGNDILCSLIFDNTNTILYGTAYKGGTSNDGTIFSFDLTTNTLHTLYVFTGIGNDGSSPHGSFIFNNTSTILYGTTQNGGQYGYGTIFSFNINTNTLITLHSFTNSEGHNPFSSLILNETNNTLYSTTYEGGTHNKGTLFSLNLNNNSLTTIYNFSGVGTDGATVLSSVILDNNQTILYGTTQNGGTYNNGTVFSFNLNTNILTTLHDFSDTNNDGSWPRSSLVFNDKQTILYGTTQNGGPNDKGTIFLLETLLFINNSINFSPNDPPIDPIINLYTTYAGNTYGLGILPYAIFYDGEISNNYYSQQVVINGRTFLHFN